MPRRLALTSPARRTPHSSHPDHPGHSGHSSDPGHPRRPEPPGHSEHGGHPGNGGHPQARPHRYRARFGALAAGAVPVLAFPAPGQAWLAWVALVPGMLLMQRAPGGREAAVRGWWFGAGFILIAMYWLVPSIGPGLPVLAVLFGALQGGFGYAVHRLLHPPLTGRRALLALLVVPAVWVTTEYARSWDALGGPWALLGATQWQHPAILGLASTGGIWLVSAAVAAANTGVLIVLTAVHRRPRALAALTTVLVLAAGPLLFALRDAPAPAGAVTVALVQPGIVDDPQARFEASAQATAALGGQPVDLVVWGESSTTADLDRDPAALDRLRRLSTVTGAQIIAGEDARKADGRISKDAVLVSPRACWTATARSGWCPSASTSRCGRCSAGSPASAGRPARTGRPAPPSTSCRPPTGPAGRCRSAR